jgi:hypothetical protein
MNFGMTRADAVLIFVFVGLGSCLNLTFGAQGVVPGATAVSEDTAYDLVQEEAERLLSDRSLSAAAREEGLLKLLRLPNGSELSRLYAADAIGALGTVQNIPQIIVELHQPGVSDVVAGPLLRVIGESVGPRAYVSSKGQLDLADRDIVIRTLREFVSAPGPRASLTAIRELEPFVPGPEALSSLRQARTRGFLKPIDYAREILAILPDPKNSGVQAEALDDLLATANSTSEPGEVALFVSLLSTAIRMIPTIELLQPQNRVKMADFLDRSGPKLKDSATDFSMWDAVQVVSCGVARNKLRGVPDSEIPGRLLDDGLSPGAANQYLVSLLMSPYAKAVIDQASSRGITDSLVSRLQSAKERSVDGSLAQSTYTDALAVIASIR